MYLKVYASKFISTYQILCHLDRSCCRDKVNGLPANAQLSLFLQSHLDSFIITHHTHTSPGLCKNKSNRDTDGNKPYRRPLGVIIFG